MGIRINKVLGYALTDVRADTNKWEITDPRFNKDGYTTDWEDSKFTIEGFKEHLIAKIKEIGEDDLDRFNYRLTLRGLEAKEGDMFRYPLRGFYECVTYDMEFGSPNVIVFSPISCHKEWKRYDNAIDYYDPANSDDGAITESVIKLNRPLWPWDTYTNIKLDPPETLKYEQQHFISILQQGFVDGDEDEYVQKMGFDNVADMEKHVIPTIPPEVVEMIKYLKIFKDEKTIYELRPVIYGYWS